jgi:hypothetical protein
MQTEAAIVNQSRQSVKQDFSENLQAELDTDIRMSAWLSLTVGGYGRGYEGGIVY